MISEISEGFDAVIEREVEVVRHLGGLIARDQCGQRDNAAVARVEAGALPKVAEQSVLLIFFKGGRDRAHIVARLLRIACAADGREQRQRCECHGDKLHIDLLCVFEG